MQKRINSVKNDRPQKSDSGTHRDSNSKSEYPQKQAIHRHKMRSRERNVIKSTLSKVEVNGQGVDRSAIPGRALGFWRV